MIKVGNFIKSLHHATHGIRFSLGGKNFKIQLIAAILVLLVGILVGLSKTEWLIIILLIFLVLAIESLNTAIEEVCNVVKDLPGIEQLATKKARDIAAGSALIISICAFIIGLIIFLPKIINLFT